MIARRFARPLRFRWRGRPVRVRRVEATWEAGHGWWRGAAGAIRRRYHRLDAHGLRCVVYHDLASGGWFLEQISD